MRARPDVTFFERDDNESVVTINNVGIPHLTALTMFTSGLYLKATLETVDNGMAQVTFTGRTVETGSNTAKVEILAYNGIFSLPFVVHRVLRPSRLLPAKMVNNLLLSEVRCMDIGSLQWEQHLFSFQGGTQRQLSLSARELYELLRLVQSLELARTRGPLSGKVVRLTRDRFVEFVVVGNHTPILAEVFVEGDETYLINQLAVSVAGGDVMREVAIYLHDREPIPVGDNFV